MSCATQICSTYSEEEIEAFRERLRQLAENTQFFDKLFWKATADQFGIVIGERAFGFTEDFEVYVDP